MDYLLEVVTVPVSDVDRSVEFYTQRVGFRLDVDYAPTDDFRLVQLTPPGSSCSVQFGVGLISAEPGSARGLSLMVKDIAAAQRELSERGVETTNLRHKSPLDEWEGGWASGEDSDRRDYASFVDFADPDGNVWTLQERGFQAG